MGRAIATALAREGADLGLVGRTASSLAETARLVEETGRAALVVPADVGVAADVRRAAGAIVERFSRIDVLVNNAGTNTSRRLFANTDVDDWDQVIATNLTGVFLCTRAVLPFMRQQRDGVIVNISSLSARGASIKAGVAYSASKFGVTPLTQMVNIEEWRNNIRATAILPGDTVTPILERRPVPPSPEARAPMLKAEDIAAAVVFVATLPPHVLIEDLAIRPTNRES
ncbi:MAG: SDR family oxidoreductase [Chloroflexi bacterium]|nr:SDR family oxidoreductase [Chloroflexota bacterium]